MSKPTSASHPPPTKPQPKILIRRAHLWEAPALAKIAAATYDVYPKTLSSWLSPHRHQYWADYQRGFTQRQWARILNPRVLTMVAVSSDAPNVPVGYVGFDRKGTDAGAQRQIASRDTYFLRLLQWVVWLFYLIQSWIVGKDRSEDQERVREFKAANEGTDSPEKDYWSVDGRENRWHVQSMVVKSEWQKRGIGSMLMAEVIARSEEEGVIVGLEASEQGEPLYRRVGFELLARFKLVFAVMTDADPDVGGHFMYTPKRLRKGKA